MIDEHLAFFPWNRRPMTDEQRARLGPIDTVLEATALIEADWLYRNGGTPQARTAAIHQMERLADHGSEAAKEIVRLWVLHVLGPPPPIPICQDN